MPPPKPITPALFNEIKQKHRHHWIYLGEWRQETRNKKMVLCRCGLCSSKHWVMWRWLVENKSTRCKACARIPVGEDLESLNKDLARRGSLDQLTGDTRPTGKGVRQYQARCGGCNKLRWATLESIVKTKGCRSCMLSWCQTKVKPTPGWKERKQRPVKVQPTVIHEGTPIWLPMGNKAV